LLVVVVVVVVVVVAAARGLKNNSAPDHDLACKIKPPATCHQMNLEQSTVEQGQVLSAAAICRCKLRHNLKGKKKQGSR